MRTVSLLPSTTEILFALGAGDQVVGVTFECDYPVDARTRRIVSTTAIPEGLAPGEIDAFVTRAMAAGEDLYHLDAGALAELDAELVVTQDLCAVCAVDVSKVDDALDYLGCRAQVLTVDPHTLGEVLDSITILGDCHRHPGASDRPGPGTPRASRRCGHNRCGTGRATCARPRVDRPTLRTRSLGPRDGGRRGRQQCPGYAG